jgi:osmotically-inducible protein OsmY
MNTTPTRSFRTALLVSLAIALSPLAAARAQSEAVDLTAVFRSAGVDIADLRVYQISDIVLIRGTAARGQAENASTVAKNLGYQRVANLIYVAEAKNDTDIVRFAERSLVGLRALDGCKFYIDSLDGIVRIGGSVYRELQKDVAVELLRKIDGVKEVHSTLKVL